MPKRSECFSINRPIATFVIWLFFSAIVTGIGYFSGTRTILPGPTNLYELQSDSIELATFKSGIPPKDSLLILLEHADLTYDSEEFSSARNGLISDLKAIKSPLSGEVAFEKIRTAGHSLFEDEHYVSSDKKAVIVTAATRQSIDHASSELALVPKAISDWELRHPGFSAFYLSDGTANIELFDLIHRDLDRSLYFTLPLTMAVLVWAFGSIFAASVPIVIASVSLATALGLSALLSHILGPISATASQLVVLLVLAIGVDYSLFIIKRVREECAQGLDYKSAVLRARETTGSAVFWSAVIVALSLCGLFLMRDTVLASMAVVSILAVFITLMGSLTALPAILILAEKYIWRSRNESNPAEHSSLFGGRLIRTSLNHPKTTLILSSIFLIGLSYFAFFLKFGSTIEPELFPKDTQVHRAFEVLKNRFPDLAGTDFSILLRGEKLNLRDDQGDFQPLFDKLLSWDAVRGPFEIEYSQDGSVARYQFLAKGGGNSPLNQNLIRELRDSILPSLSKQLGIEASVRGTLPYLVTDHDRYLERSPEVFGAVLAASFIFLLIAFRSIVIPVKAILLNILSTTCAFGCLVLYFQIAKLPGETYFMIEGFVPPLLFSILFGLSMDYHVFLLSRVKEEFILCGDMKLAVERAIQMTFQTITSAALIMVAVFVVIASLELPVMKQLGVGLAIAVLVDATVIRCLLLPSSLVLLGRWNWYFPRFFRRSP